MKVVSEPQLDFLVNGGFCLRFRFRFFALAKLVKKLEYSMIAMQILQDYARGGWGRCYEKWKK